jgi:hypothetical protein
MLLLCAYATSEAQPAEKRLIGIAAIKEQPFHSDASATVVAYTALVDDRMYSIKINTGLKEFAFERTKLAGRVEFLLSLPQDIRTEAELASVRLALKDSSSFSTRFPKSAPMLTNQIAALAAYIDSFEQGARRIGGQWVDKKTIQELERAEMEKAVEAKNVEAKRLAEVDRVERARSTELQNVARLKAEEAVRADQARNKSMNLQNQALEALRNGDSISAASLLTQACKASTSTSVSVFTNGVNLFVQMRADKSLNAVDVDWRNPMLPAWALSQKDSELLFAIRSAEKQDIHPVLAPLPEGLEAAQLLSNFSADCRPKNERDQAHPIRAMKKLKNSEGYRQFRGIDTFFAKPFLTRLSALEKLISPKEAEYDACMNQGKELERNGLYQKAALKYRAALDLEPSEELETIINKCEEKTTGF